MIPSSFVNQTLRDLRVRFTGVAGLVSLTVHGSGSTLSHDVHYVDLDLIFVFEDAVVESGLADVRDYFTGFVKAHEHGPWRIIYRAQSGPMHPLRSSEESQAVASLRQRPILFCHVSVFPRSFYRSSGPKARRPSRLLIRSWESYDPLVGLALRQLAGVERLTIDDLLHEGLGFVDSIRMLRSQTRDFWDWQREPDGRDRMVWRSAPWTDFEHVEIPLYAFKWAVVNGARVLRALLPCRSELTDREVFETFLLTPTGRGLAAQLFGEQEKLAELRLEYSEQAHRAVQSDGLRIRVLSLLESVTSRLESLKHFRPRRFAFSMHGVEVPIITTLDVANELSKLEQTLNPDLAVVVADTNLTRTYDVQRLLGERARPVQTIHLDPSQKTLGGLTRILEEAERKGLTGRSMLVAWGGGNVGNTAGLAAGLICRGARLVHVPTTVLAQLDSAIGGKQSVNGELGKNYAGLFHPPSAVLVQPLFLLSLAFDEVSQGLVEALKHGLCEDADLVERVAQYAARRDEAPWIELVAIVERTIELKLRYLACDPLENDRHSLLELGHKVGHAIEFLYQELGHGHSVAIGIVAETSLFVSLGLSSEACLEYVCNAVARVIPDGSIASEIDALLVAKQLLKDNKRDGTSVPFAYLADPQLPRQMEIEVGVSFQASVSKAIDHAKARLGSLR